MKRLFALPLVLTIVLMSTTVTAQKFSGLDKSPMDMASFPTDYKVSDKVVRIIYGRPQLKSRTLAELAPVGQVWRTGANEAPEITFYQDVKVAGTDVQAGTYALLTIPGEDEWTVILHKGLNEWGSYFYKDSNDIVRVKAAASTDGTSLEEFSIAFKEVDGGAHMVMGWDTTRVAVPIMW